MLRIFLMACLIAQSPAADQAEDLKRHLLENFGAIQRFSAEFHLESQIYETDGSGVVIQSGSSWVKYRYDGANHYIEKASEGSQTFSEVVAWHDGKMSMLVHDKEGYHALTDGDEPRQFASQALLLSPRTILKLSPLLDSPPLEDLFAELRFVGVYERDYTILSFYWESEDRFMEFYMDRDNTLRRVEYCERPLPKGRPNANEPPRSHLEDIFPGDPFDLRIPGYRVDYEQWENVGEGIQFPVQVTLTQNFPVQWEYDQALRHRIYESNNLDEALQLNLEKYLQAMYILREEKMLVTTLQVNPEFTKDDFVIDYPPGTVFAYWRESDVPRREPPSSFGNLEPTGIAIIAAIGLAVLSGVGLLFFLWSGLRKTPRP